MRKTNSFGDIFGAIAGGFSALIKGLIRLLLKLLVTFGLWLPILYVLLGVILYYGAGFDPLGFDVYSIIYLSGGVACIVCAVIITVRNVFVMPVKSVFTRRRDKINDMWADEEFAAREQAERLAKEKRERDFSPPEGGEYPLFNEKEQENKKKFAAEDKEEIPEYLIDADGDEDEDEETDDRKSASALLFDWVPAKKEPKAKPKMKSVPKKEIPEVYFSKLNPSLLVHEYSDRFELFKVVGDKTEYVGVEYK